MINRNGWPITLRPQKSTPYPKYDDTEYEGKDEVRKSLASTFHTCLHQEHSEDDDEEQSEDDDK